jgi:hypothetical protein
MLERIMRHGGDGAKFADQQVRGRAVSGTPKAAIGRRRCPTRDDR